MKYEYINTAGNMSVRPSPNVNNTPSGTLPMNVKGQGDTLEIYPNGDKWLKLNTPVVGWVAVIHNGQPYGQITEIAVEPEPTNKLVPLTVTIEGEGYKSVTVDLIPNDAD